MLPGSSEIMLISGGSDVQCPNPWMTPTTFLHHSIEGLHTASSYDPTCIFAQLLTSSHARHQCICTVHCLQHCIKVHFRIRLPMEWQTAQSVAASIQQWTIQYLQCAALHVPLHRQCSSTYAAAEGMVSSRCASQQAVQPHPASQS